MIDEVVTADYQAAQQVAKDGPLVFGQWVDEDGGSDAGRPACVGDFAGLAGAQ